MRAVFRIYTGERGSGGQEAGVPAHYDVDLHARKRAVVEVIAHERLGHEFRAGTKAGRVVVLAQVVVDGLANVEAVQIVICLASFLIDDVRGFGGIVAADVKEVTNAVLL